MNPAADVVVAAAAPAGVAPRSVPTAPRARILLVEDEPVLRELLEDYLVCRGYAVHAVADGRLAARWLAGNPTDIVVTDLCMPGTDGVELLVELRRQSRPVAVVAMSGGFDGDPEKLLRVAKLLGARWTLSKPFSLEQLLGVLDDIVRRR